MKVPKSQNGFSLVEVLVVLAISSILGMTILQTMRDSTNAMALSEAKFEEIELMRQIQTNLIYKPACTANLRNKVLNDLSIDNIQKLIDSNDNLVALKGAKVGNNSLLIKDLKFSITEAARTDFETFKATLPAAGATYMMDMQFELRFEKLKTTLGGKELVRNIPIKIKIDATNTIKECFAASDATAATALSNFCQQMGGSYDSATDLCQFSQACSSYASAQMIPTHCVDEKMKSVMDSMKTVMLDLLKDRAPAAVVAAATPVPTPSTLDPYTLPFSKLNPGPGCTGVGCAASDYGPCKGDTCTTNGGTCSGTFCTAGVTTGVVAWDGKNSFTPANPGPGCKGVGCHASDYGPCDGDTCTTNGGSCKGTFCATGIK